MMFLDGLLSFILIVLMLLVGVAFLTLLERKVLGYIQIRKGPNKVGIMGLFQPFSDAVKLFSKEVMYPLKSNYLLYYFCPIVSFILVFIMWSVIPYMYMYMNFEFGVLFLMVCLSLGVYGIMLAGWSSSSVYSILGGLRAVAQTISYEVSLSFILLCLLILCGNYRLIDFFFFQEICWFFFCSIPLFFMLFISMLAETNRTPFDFAEGESELVSGFNVEYSSGGFALIFLAEYSSILLMSMLCTLVFFGCLFNLFFFFFVLFLGFLFIWIRGSLPRYRYDKLMNLCWKSFLPVVLFFIIFYFSVKMFIVIMV